jgi:hypothetical protein
MFNHGSTGKGTNSALFTETLFDVDLADFLNNRGWIVVFPQRRGRGRSDGLYDEGFSRYSGANGTNHLLTICLLVIARFGAKSSNGERDVQTE